MVRASLIWAVPLFALTTSPWLLGWGTGSGFLDLDLATLARVALAAAVGPFLVAIALITWFPHARYGDWVARRIGQAGGHPTNRAVNLADQLGLATGAYRHRVMAVDSPVPNVAAIPGAEGTTVVVTAGAEHQLPRDDLEALMATQVVVASDRWVQVASAAQLVSAPRFAVLFGAGFLNPVLIPLAFVAFFGHRRGDAVRDMVADSAALRATRHPEALSRSLYELRRRPARQPAPGRAPRLPRRPVLGAVAPGQGHHHRERADREPAVDDDRGDRRRDGDAGRSHPAGCPGRPRRPLRPPQLEAGGEGPGP